MRGVRCRRPLAALGLLALSLFSCSYGDREDKQEDAEATRTALAPPASTVTAGPARG